MGSLKILTGRFLKLKNSPIPSPTSAEDPENQARHPKPLSYNPGSIPGESEALGWGGVVDLCGLQHVPSLDDTDFSHSCELLINPAMLGIYVPAIDRALTSLPTSPSRPGSSVKKCTCKLNVSTFTTAVIFQTKDHAFRTPS